MQPLNFLRRIDRAADHLDGRSYFLLGRQLSPGQHSLLQGGAISRDARAIVQGRWSASIGVDFVVVAHQRTQFSMDCAGQGGREPLGFSS
jgi:hypothetical protein